MKENRNFLLAIVFCLLIIGTLAFLCMPPIVHGASFFLGFIACLVLVSIALTGVFIKRRKLLSATKTQTYIGLLITALIVLIGSAGSYTMIKQNEQVEAQKRYQQTQDEHQVQLKESIRIKGLMFIMGNLINHIEDELSQSSERTLSDHTISRIADLSHSFLPDPFNYVENDSLSEEKLSQERGQLLLALVRLQIDSNSFKKIMLKTPFSRADLNKADLKGANLNGIDLMSANLKGADLSGAKFRQADLRGAVFWGANLNSADLSAAKMNRANLRWANLNETIMIGADMEGAHLQNAKFRNAHLSKAFLRYSCLSGAFFNEADLTEAVLFGADLRKVEFSGANLMNADLRTANICEAILKDADLTGAQFRKTGVKEKNWLIMLEDWNVNGSKEIQKQYKIEEDLSGQANYSIVKIE